MVCLGVVGLEAGVAVTVEAAVDADCGAGSEVCCCANAVAAEKSSTPVSASGTNLAIAARREYVHRNSTPHHLDFLKDTQYLGIRHAVRMTQLPGAESGSNGLS